MARTLLVGKFPWGAIQGAVALPAVVKNAAAVLAKKHLADCEAVEFSGEAVEDYLFPDWMAARRDWIPTGALAALDFAPLFKDESLLATVGVDPHIDDVHQATFALVLHNDGLRFKQGKQSHVTATGEWFIFDDSVKHGVREGKDTSSYLLWSVPLRRLIP